MFKQKEEILFEWVASKAVAIESARSFNKYGLTAFPRGFAIITVLLTILYFVFDYLFPPGFSFNLLKMFLITWLGGIGWMFLGYFIFPWICIFDRTRCRITPQGFRVINGNNPRVLKWKDLKGFVLSESQTIPGQRDITLLTEGRPRIIHLPNNNLDEQIIQYVSGQLPVFQSIPLSIYPAKLTFFQKCCFILCTVLYSGAVSCYIVFKGIPSFPGSESEFGGVILLILILFLGPGTICSFGMTGLAFFKNKLFKFYAIFFNLLGLVLLILVSMILLLWQLKKIGGW